MSLPLYVSVTVALWLMCLLAVWKAWHDGRDPDELIAMGLVFLILSCGWPTFIPLAILIAVGATVVRFVLFPVFNKLFASYLE